MTAKCPLCRRTETPLLSFKNLPAVNFLKPSTHEVLPHFDLTCSVCDQCGLVNLFGAPDTDFFYAQYATPSAWKSEPHLPDLLALIAKEFSKDQSIIDIGCNDGKFLLELKKLGFKRLFGLEPSSNTATQATSKGLTVKQAYLNPKVAKDITYAHGQFDVLTVRQVLEHVPDLLDFGAALNTLSHRDTFLIIEVPDFNQNLENYDYTLWEEHINYFTEESLSYYLGIIGWHAITVKRAVFSGQCLSVIAKKGPITREAAAQEFSRSKINDWASRFHEVRAHAHKQISHAAKSGSVILHGVGNRSSFWVNVMEVHEFIDAAVDDQPAKQGKYMPKSNVPIVSVEEARQLKPSLVLLGVNTENEQRVTPFWDGISPVASILPPSDLLLWRDLLASPQAG